MQKITDLIEVSRVYGDSALTTAARRLAKRLVDKEFGFVGSPPTVCDSVGYKIHSWASEDFTDEEKQFLRENRKLETVKSVRNRLNMMLIDAKHYVEDRIYS